MAARSLVAILTFALVAGACGSTTSTAAPGDPGDATTPSASAGPGPTATARPGSSGPTTTSEPTGGPAPLPTPGAAEIATLVGRPIETASTAGDRTIRHLVDASGPARILGADSEPATLALIEADHAAARATLQQLGVDPARLGRRRDATARLAETSVGSAIGSMGVILGMTAGLFETAFGDHDAAGNVRRTLDFDPVTTVRDGLTISVMQTARIDVAHCPDATGGADGTISIDVALHAGGTVDGTPISVGASTALTFSLAATADDQAALSATAFQVTGTLVTTSAADGDAHTDFSGSGARLPIGADGTPDARGVTGWGEWISTAPNADAIAVEIAKVGMIAGFANGKAGAAYWQAGRCVRLDITPPDPRIARSGGLALNIGATSAIDDAAVDGTVTVTPERGTFAPATGTAPLGTTASVAGGDGEASADVEFRSRRGRATASVQVVADDYAVDYDQGGFRLTGRKCGGPVGAWHMTLSGKVNEGGITAKFSGSIDVTVAADLTATYRAKVTVKAAGLPASVTAALGFSGGGHALFDAENLQMEFLDGTMAGTATGTGPGASITMGLQPTRTGTSALAVQRSACGE